MKRLFIFPILIFVGFVLAIYLALPLYYQMADLKSQKNYLENELSQTKSRLDDLRLIKEKLKKYQTALDIVETALPSQPSIPYLFSYLSGQASNNGLFLETISQSQANAKKTQAKQDSADQSATNNSVEEINVAVSLSGQTSSLESFLAALEKSAWLIDLENLEVASGETSQKTGEVALPTFNLLLRAYQYNK